MLTQYIISLLACARAYLHPWRVCVNVISTLLCPVQVSTHGFACPRILRMGKRVRLKR